MTPEEAENLHRRITAGGDWLVWFVRMSGPPHSGKAVAWALLADKAGGTRQDGELVADTLDELRAMLPRGLTRRERTMVMPPDVVETWD